MLPVGQMSKMNKCGLGALAVSVVLLGAGQAHAACTRLAFSVNDYGKEGPTRDAKNLLDKYIAREMGNRGVSNYRTGPKSVKCDLFLDFVVFDEYTCRAEATVCWGGSVPDGSASASSDPEPNERDSSVSTGSIEETESNSANDDSDVAPIEPTP